MKHALEEYEENVTALKKLFQGKTQPAQMVQNLLDTTRQLRAEWIKKVGGYFHSRYFEEVSFT